MSHTPGPWKVMDIVRAFPGIEAERSSIVVFGDEGEDSGVRGKTRDERMANARLISAAPDLLEACKQALDSITDASGLWTNPHLGKLLTAAIAKAEGQ